MSLSKPLTLRHLCHLLNNILGLFYQRGENGHNLDIWVLRLSQGQMQIFLCLKVWKGLDFQKWGLNRVHETERSFFQYHGFSACVDADSSAKSKKG